MRRLALLLALLLPLAVLGLTSCTPVQTDATVAGVSYRLYTDSDLGTAQRPLLLFLGGNGQSADDLENSTKLAADVLNKGWSLAYLVNDSKRWNSGTCCTSVADTSRTISVLNDIKARVPTDVRKVYIGGFSNGSAEAADVLWTYPATFAAGEGVGFPHTRPGQVASIPIRWRHWHATNDALVPIGGGCVKNLDGTCSGLGTALSTYNEPSSLPSGSTYKLTTYGGNHTWNGVTNSDYLDWLAQFSR